MLKGLKTGAYLGAGAGLAGYVALKCCDIDTQFNVLSELGSPFRTIFDAETSHAVGIKAIQLGLFPKDTRHDLPSLKTSVWNKNFSNPIGLAAGFDKNAEAVEGLMGLGFGFVEVGSVTPKPQPGNPQPRVFRIPELGAVINRYGFNNLGASAVEDNLKLFRLKTKKAETPGDKPPALLGINLGKNKNSKDAAMDYCIGLTKLAYLADYVVINVSSPNTPGLRALQGREQLQSLISQVKGTRDRVPENDWGSRGVPPLLIKIAPDLTEDDKADIAAVALQEGVDGLIISNTTIQRPGAAADSDISKEAGGLSGVPLFQLSTQVLKDMYRLTGGRVPIVGVGGVTTGEDAYKKIRAGASLVQIYTALAYEGPAMIPRMKKELADCLKRDGFATVAEAVGADHKLNPADWAAQQARVDNQTRRLRKTMANGESGRSWWRFW